MFKLDEANLRLYAARHYNNTSCLGEEEFKKDLNIPSRISQQLSKPESCNIRLLSNLVIIFFNVFEYDAARKLIYFLTEKEYHSRIKTILVFLGRAHPDDNPALVECEELKQMLQKEFEQ